MVEEKIYTVKEALEKGYLVDKKVFLKPIPKRGSAMIKDPSHIGYFMWEGAKKSFCLPADKYGVLVSPFRSEEEGIYLSKLVDVDLNIRKNTSNFWHDFEVSVTKTPMFMNKGIELNLADPMDNIRWRILKLQREVAPDWDARFEKPSYMFAFVEDDYEEKVENAEMDRAETIYTYWGSIKNSPKKMREFLGTYLMEKRINKIISDNDTKEFLTSEIQKIIKNDSDTAYRLIQDEDMSTKYMIFNLVQLGAIRKKGVGTYNIIGTDEKDLSFKDLVREIKFLKETTDPIYIKLEAQLNTKK